MIARNHKITVSHPDLEEEFETTWGEFVDDNSDDDMLDDVLEQIAANNYAEIGGGAQPIVWIFA